MKKKLMLIYIVVCVLLVINIYSFYLVCFPLKYKQTVLEYSNKYGVESALVFAIIKAESFFDDRAVSRVGAKGLMQIMEQTAQYISLTYDIDINEKDYLFNSKKNIELGCAYLNYLIKKFNNVGFVICAYNAGEGRVSEWINEKIISVDNFSNIPYKETKDYYNKVIFNYTNYKNRLK